MLVVMYTVNEGGGDKDLKFIYSLRNSGSGGT